jgi:hypothetical protein
MGRTLRRVIAVCAAAAVIFGAPLASHAAPTDQQRAVWGAAFLAEAQRPNGSLPAFSPIGSTADAVLAFVSAGVRPGAASAALEYLRRQTAAGNVTGVGLSAKVALAVSAMGLNPRQFGGHNLIAEIRSTEDADGRFGDGTATVFDEALAVLAFRGADTRASRDTLAWLRTAQCPDGGWAFDEPYDPADDTIHCRSRSAGSSDFFLADTNTTAYVVQALEASGNAPYPVNPFAFFAAIRDPERGGWGYTWGFRATDTNSTALALQAYAAAGRATPRGSLAALRRLQWPGSGWGFTWDGTQRGPADLGSTIGAIPGLLLDPLPIEAASSPGA